MKIKDREDELYQSLTLEYLRFFGNKNPLQIQIKAMKSILFNSWLKRSILFDKRLTAREKACLYLTSYGNNSKQTADILGIKFGTVRIHRQAIMRKLNCKNMSQAVSVGIKYGDFSLTEN